ncbi:MAG: hypothetical protein H6579_10590 [Chitinophagales bacterium]|nr:hypothetical protein [Bacteroidota bacterium]MCB9257569.1 hypothetical protein [Chitinophagales bacterium]
MGRKRSGIQSGKERAIEASRQTSDIKDILCICFILFSAFDFHEEVLMPISC